MIKADLVTVRAMRVRFTGAEAFRSPVQARAYGSARGSHWFPAGTLPAGIAPSTDER